ncbi:MAG: hypothetical protein JWR15_3165 [Prosthecobacter sp.]|nr:hypothetical protein [Prosthecobacter sp.]
MKSTIFIIAVLIAGVVLYLWLRPRPTSLTLSDASPPRHTIRDTLFGDMPLEDWSGDGQTSPWTLFAAAKQHLDSGHNDDAIASLKQVLALPDLEPRHYLQAWHFLRPLGQKPSPDEARRVLGVVIEVSMQDGLDIVAAYPDHSARYYNFSGAGVVWEHPDTSLDGAIDRLISAGTAVVQQIGPWDGPRPAPPPKNQVRLSFLTPGGLCFGQGSFQDLSADPKGGAVVTAATDLMRALIAKSPKQAP